MKMWLYKNIYISNVIILFEYILFAKDLNYNERIEEEVSGEGDGWMDERIENRLLL